MASHEFRTPLAAILATTETLTIFRDKLDSVQIDARLDKIRQQVLHLKAVMEDVLQLARIQAGRVDYKPTRGDIHALCQEIVEEFDSMSEYCGRIVYGCNKSSIPFLFDNHLMRQVISNLVSNALKYSPQEKSVFVTLLDEETSISIVVKDEGIGIPPEDLKHLFEPFHRATNVGTISGTGLGLSISKQAVELHGGTIIPETEVGKGTTFTISLNKAIAKEGDRD